MGRKRLSPLAPLSFSPEDPISYQLATDPLQKVVMTSCMQRREGLVFASLLIVCGAGLVVWTLQVNAARPAIQDEVVQLWQAEQLSEGRLAAPVPQPADFVDVPSILVKDGRRFGQYLSGYPLALVPWVLLGIPWALNLSLATTIICIQHSFVRVIA